MTTANLFELALERHRAGDLPDAEARYRQVLAQDPTHAPSAFLLGGIALGSGSLPAAVELLKRAATLDPNECGLSR